MTDTFHSNLAINRIARAVRASGIPIFEHPSQVASTSLTHHLGPAYCISLASRPERRAFCQQQFAADAVSVRFFDAIEPQGQSKFPSRGAYGCYQSHIRVLELGLAECRRTGADHLTVFEDDVLLPRGFARVVETVAPMLANLDWTFFYWGTQNRPAARPVPGHEPVVEVAPQQTIIGKQAYSVRTSVIPDLLAHLRECGTRPSPGYSDGMFHEFRMDRNLSAHTHTLAAARQGSFASNITPTPLNWARHPLRLLKRHVQLWSR